MLPLVTKEGSWIVKLRTATGKEASTLARVVRVREERDI